MITLTIQYLKYCLFRVYAVQTVPVLKSDWKRGVLYQSSTVTVETKLLILLVDVTSDAD